MTSSSESIVGDALKQALMHHQAGRLAEAAHWYRRVLQQAPEQGDANHNFGLLLNATEGVAAALPYLAKAASIDPDQTQYILSYSSALLDAGNPGQAAALIDDALARGIVSAPLHCNRGNAARALGRIDEAEAQFRQALRLDPQYAFAWYNLGCLLQDEGRMEEAVESYRTARQFAPGLIEAGCNLATVLHAIGRLDEAVTAIAAVLSHHPDYAEGYRQLGALLEAEGRNDEAWQCYARAIALEPGDADTAYRAGLVLCRLNRLQEAAAHFRSAIEADKMHGLAYNELGNTLRQLGSHEDALKSYAAAAKVKPGFAEAFCNLGNAYLESGDIASAEKACRRALELDPALLAGWFNLGNVLRAAHQTEAAVAAYRHAVSLHPEYAAAWCNLGLTIQATDRVEAEACCRRALQCAPDMPQALVFLADIVSDQGRFQEAEQLLHRAIAVAPDMAAAWAGLPMLRKMTALDRPWLEKAEQVANGNLTIHQAAHLQFSIGKFLDDVKEYDAAFVHYRRANELSKQFTPAYDAVAETKAVDDLCGQYNADFFVRHRKTQESMLPVFVIGMPRSGTSLMEQIIAAHPQAAGAGELPFWSLAANKLEHVRADFEECLSQSSSDYLALLGKAAPGRARVVDKMPGNFRHLGLIHAAFPQARIIHVRRDPIDTCLSIYFQHFNEAHSYANDLHSLADYHAQYRRLMAHWKTVIGSDRMLEVDYENLVADQEAWTRSIIDFIGLQWDPACLDFHNASGRIGTASKWQARQKISNASVQRWRHYESHIAPLLKLQ